MQTQDTSTNRRIASLWRLNRELHKTTTPEETMRAVRLAFMEAYGGVASIMLSTRGLPAGEFRVVSMNLDPAVLREDDFSLKPAIYRGGVIARLIDKDEPRLIQAVDWSTDPYFAELLAEYRSVISLPLASTRLPMTAFLLLAKAPAQLGVDDLEQAVLRTALVGSLLESKALVGDLGRANEKIDRELRKAGELQRLLLPSPLPTIRGLELAVSYEPSGRAGGDLYDLFRLAGTGESEQWCILIADASGHDLVAAVMMAMVQSILRAHPPGILGPSDLLAHINCHLCDKKIGGFMTAFIGIYQPASGKLVYSSAGHPPPLVCRQGQGHGHGQACYLDSAKGLPLGIQTDVLFSEAAIELCPGDSILLYTDGITDARDRNGNHFDTAQIEQVVSECGLSPADMIEKIRGLVRLHEGDRPPGDDQTMLAVRVSMEECRHSA
jgi:sigma-B regulation protein RsbU (phosphoserine phosphatase)